jgi:hypothetical protein
MAGFRFDTILELDYSPAPLTNNDLTGKEGSVADGQRVLLVDGIEETQEVLSAVLGPRGMIVDRTPAWKLEHTSPITAHDVVVLDSDRHVLESPQFAGQPQVILGSLTVPCEDSGAPRRFLQKPFHYGELIQAIESLLCDGTLTDPSARS